MRTTFKTNKLVALLTTALVAGLFFILYDDLSHLSVLQRERVVEKQIFFDQVVAMKSDPVRRLVLDYSFWDDMVKFAANPDPFWAQGNIDSSFASYQHDALWVFSPDGVLIYSVNCSENGLEHGAFPLPSDRMRLLFAAKEKFPHFFVVTGQGVMEVFGAAIQSHRDGKRQGAPAGFFLAGMLWDRAHLRELSQLTRSAVIVQNPGDSDAGKEWHPRRGVISFSRPLAGIDGTPVKNLVIRMESPEIRQLAREMGNNALIGTALIAVLAILVIFAFVSRQRLKNANLNLDVAQQMALLGSWQRDVESGTCSWSDNLYRIFGLPVQGATPGLETLYSLVYPEDLPRVRETVERSVQDKRGYEVEFRIVRPDGAVRIMRSKGEVCLVEGGVCTCVMGSTQDITERSLLERELSILVRQKDAFIVRLGHDLKSPLTPLLALLPLIGERCTDVEMTRMLDICRTSVKHIERITAKTLKLARFSSPLASADLERVSLAAAADEAICRYAGFMAGNQIVCENRIPPAISVHAVSTQIEELFANLISNAVHFSPRGSVIRMTAAEDVLGVMAAVCDEGSGLEPDQLDNIFEAFYKEDEARHELGRPGLGLTICRQIVLNHGGSIWAESPGRGRGTTIRIRLPHAENATNIIPGGANTCLTSRSCSSTTKN